MPEDKEKEEIYDERISPLIMQVFELCRDHDIPMACYFEAGDKHIRVMAIHDAGRVSHATRQVVALALAQMDEEEYVSQGDTRPSPAAN